MLTREQIQAVYDQVPDVECQGKCTQACGPIGFSQAEADQWVDQGIIAPRTIHHPVHGALTCDKLSTEGRCTIYKDRPLICRLFGAVKRLKCPHGCRPKGQFLLDPKVSELFRALGPPAAESPSVRSSTASPAPRLPPG